MHLTEIAYYARKAIIFGAIAVIVLLILRQILILAIRAYKEANRPPPPPPTVLFGKLPAIPLPSEGKNYQFNFQLVTKEYGLPQMPDRYEVFFVPRRQPNFLAADRTRAFAAQLGFTTKSGDLGGDQLLFSDPSYPTRRIRINPLTNNFELIFDVTDPSVLQKIPANFVPQAVMEAQVFLQKYGLLSPNFDLNRMRTQMVTFKDGRYRETSDPNQAIGVRVNFFDTDLKQTPWITAIFDQSPNFVVLSAESIESKKILQAQIVHFPIDMNNVATYPLKTSEQAWQELINGQGYIARFPSRQSREILVRRVYLAYFQVESYQPYIQPVFVFEGDDDFVGYTPAITSDWIGVGSDLVPTGESRRNFVLPTPTVSLSPQIDLPSEATPSTPLPAP